MKQLREAQNDEYLRYFFPRLVLNELFEYGGKYIFVLEDMNARITPIPSFVREHFDVANRLGNGVHLLIANDEDMKIYIAALMHWRGRAIKDNMPQHLITSSYVPFTNMLTRFDGHISGLSQAESKMLLGLEGFYDEGLDFLSTRKATTLLHHDMRSNNFVSVGRDRNKFLYLFAVDFGKCSLGPGVLDTCRLADFTRYREVMRFDADSREKTVKYLAFMNVLNQIGKVEPEQIREGMQIYRAGIVSDAIRVQLYYMSSGAAAADPRLRRGVSNALNIAYDYASGAIPLVLR